MFRALKQAAAAQGGKVTCLPIIVAEPTACTSHEAGEEGTAACAEECGIMPRSTDAAYYLREPKEVEAFLRCLLAMAAGSGSPTTGSAPTGMPLTGAEGGAEAAAGGAAAAGASRAPGPAGTKAGLHRTALTPSHNLLVLDSARSQWRVAHLRSPAGAAMPVGAGASGSGAAAAAAAPSQRPGENPAFM
jgi:hypothetical protein